MSRDQDPPSRVVEEAVYTAVGLAVLGFQQLQVVRRDIDRALREVLDPGRARGPHDTER